MVLTVHHLGSNRRLQQASFTKQSREPRPVSRRLEHGLQRLPWRNLQDREIYPHNASDAGRELCFRLKAVAILTTILPISHRLEFFRSVSPLSPVKVLVWNGGRYWPSTNTLNKLRKEHACKVFYCGKDVESQLREWAGAVLLGCSLNFCLEKDVLCEG